MTHAPESTTDPDPPPTTNGCGRPRLNLALVGFSTTGKSTVARLLAGHLGWAAVDTDQVIAAVAGRSITDLFRVDGEAAFRAREEAALAAALAGQRKVIATGGGIVTRQANLDRLRERCVSIWLTAEPETILTRLQTAAASEPRPLLAARDPLARIRELLFQRQAAYAQADLTVDTDHRTPDGVMTAILGLLREVEPRPDHPSLA